MRKPIPGRQAYYPFTSIVLHYKFDFPESSELATLYNSTTNFFLV